MILLDWFASKGAHVTRNDPAFQEMYKILDKKNQPRQEVSNYSSQKQANIEQAISEVQAPRPNKAALLRALNNQNDFLQMIYEQGTETDELNRKIAEQFRLQGMNLFADIFEHSSDEEDEIEINKAKWSDSDRTAWLLEEERLTVKELEEEIALIKRKKQAKAKEELSWFRAEYL